VAIGYDISTDAAWLTRRARVEARLGTDFRSIELAVDADGNWGGENLFFPELSGYTDIDLGFTPATNTLPIRRLGLQVGESASVTTAWLGLPDLWPEPLVQTYTRIAPDLYRYETADGEFTAELLVDESGLAVRYADRWDDLLRP
jgi:hypothetical protein